jgi:hypothetical protein
VVQVLLRRPLLLSVCRARGPLFGQRGRRSRLHRVVLGDALRHRPRARRTRHGLGRGRRRRGRRSSQRG